MVVVDLKNKFVATLNSIAALKKAEISGRNQTLENLKADVKVTLPVMADYQQLSDATDFVDIFDPNSTYVITIT